MDRGFVKKLAIVYAATLKDSAPQRKAEANNKGEVTIKWTAASVMSLQVHNSNAVTRARTLSRSCLTLLLSSTALCVS